ncbi:alpha/beta fold hydrolase [Nocardioides sp. cx-173]|uniref:alpha/beta fold hydrolase n=1 Tax=Nocardioides sp. cx-173 TaxID=2898796 RepID=UPI001E630CEB|nr:alpha/beta hydrolase [Nocardioides sp. cx-173]MCD4524426.1 alpha/beta hydrolase [Nocardioides sp. cx-173]UGB43088.1 alpha/beta hydrolase [Nocardioides sp. cx-173]
MPTSAARATTSPALSFHDVLSDDGTVIRAWTNDPEGAIEGPTVVLCNGLGTSAYAWPALLRPDCGVRVVSWNHRGTGGSERPADPSHIEIEHFVEDGLSVMDHFGVDRAVLMGWSMGVNTMFEMAVRHPERVRGLFAVAGVPGDTFGTMLGPLRLPRAVARTVTVGLTHVLRYSDWALTPIASRLPIGPRAIRVLSHSGFMFPVADTELAATAVSEFLTTPIGWYMQLALSTSRHGRVSLSKVSVPCAFVAGRYDVLAGTRHMATAAGRVKDATYAELSGSHFIQMEKPDQVHRLLVDFLARVG